MFGTGLDGHYGRQCSGVSRKRVREGGAARACARGKFDHAPNQGRLIYVCSHESGTDSSTEICFSKFITTYLIAVIHHLYDWE